MEYQCAVLEEVCSESVSESFSAVNFEESVHNLLKNRVEEYLKLHPNLSLRSVSLRSGVAFTTLSRLVRSNVINLSPHTVLNLSAFLWKEYRLECLIDQLPRTVSSYLYEHFGKFISLKH